MPTQANRVFFVVGSTGSQKTKVAVQLAKCLQSSFNFTNVVVINCDVSQFYEDLPIATNKGDTKEFEGVPHFFMGFLSADGKVKYPPHSSYPFDRNLEPLIPQEDEELRYTIHNYQTDVVSFIDDHFRKWDHSAVIICGGTCYYMQAILFQNTLVNTTKSMDERSRISESHRDDLWAKLHEVDPAVASRYHPHDTRRLKRLLEIYEESGDIPSHFFSKQSEIRYLNSYIIWTYIDHSTLKELLSHRVDQMLHRGLLDEASSFYQTYTKLNCQSSIAESIGFKEFLPLLHLNTQLTAAAAEPAVEVVKTNTWRYARQQIQFIQNRFLPLIYSLSTAPVVVRFNVLQSERLNVPLDAFLKNVLFSEANNIESMEVPQLFGVREPVTQQTCTTCHMLVYGRDQMAQHLKSKRHQSYVKRKRLEEEYLEKFGVSLPPPRKRQNKDAEGR